MYAKDRHFLANSAPEAGNVSNREKSGTSRNFPLMCKIMAETAPTRPILSPPAAPFLSTAKEMGERTPPKTHGFWISFCRLPPRSDSSEMLNRRISLRAAAFALKCAGAQLCISRLCCSPPRGEGFQREGTRTSRSLWPVGGMGFLRERGNRNPLSLKPFFGHFLSAKKVTRRRQPRAGRRETSCAAGGKMQGAGGTEPQPCEKRMPGKAGGEGETGGGQRAKKERRESVSLFDITTSRAV